MKNKVKVGDILITYKAGSFLLWRVVAPCTWQFLLGSQSLVEVGCFLTWPWA